MQDGNRIALIHGVYFPDNARLDTMPFVLNCLRKLADELSVGHTTIAAWYSKFESHGIRFIGRMIFTWPPNISSLILFSILSENSLTPSSSAVRQMTS